MPEYVPVFNLYNKDGKIKKISSKFLHTSTIDSKLSLSEFLTIYNIFREQNPNDAEIKVSINSLYNFSAIHSNNIHIAQWLIDNGAEVNLVNTYSGMNTLLYVARDNPDLNMLDTLVKNGAHLFARSKYGTNALQFAAHNNPNPSIVSYLVHRGFSLSETDDRWSTPCMLASQNNNVQVLKRLIELGGDILEIKHGWSCLFHATRYNQSIEMLEFLVSELPKSYINSTDLRHRVPLIYAIEYCEDLKITKLLLNNGADPTIPDQNGWTSLHWALIYDDKNEEIIPFLLSHYKFPTTTNETWYGLNLFDFACRKVKNPKTLKLLLSHGIEPNNIPTCIDIARNRFNSANLVEFLLTLEP